MIHCKLNFISFMKTLKSKKKELTFIMGTLPFLYEGGAWVFLVFPKRAMGSGFSNKKGDVSKMRLLF